MREKHNHFPQHISRTIAKERDDWSLLVEKSTHAFELACLKFSKPLREILSHLRQNLRGYNEHEGDIGVALVYSHIHVLKSEVDEVYRDMARSLDDLDIIQVLHMRNYRETKTREIDEYDSRLQRYNNMTVGRAFHDIFLQNVSGDGLS